MVTTVFLPPEKRGSTPQSTLLEGPGPPVATQASKETAAITGGLKGTTVTSANLETHRAGTLQTLLT